MRIRFGPDGLHAFDRVSGLNVLLGEVRTNESRYARAPRFVSFALTYACDLHCSFCYAPKFRAQLAPETVLAWARELDENGCLGVGFGGGEPTLFPGFADLCRKVSTSTGLSVTFTTHAHHLTDKMCSALSGHVHFVRASMDGVGRTYERIRGRRFAAFLEHASRASGIAPLGINYVVNDATIGDLGEAAEVAVSLGACEMLLLPELAVDSVSQTTLNRLTEWTNGYCGPLRLAVSEDRVPAGVVVGEPFDTDRGLGGYLHVTATGRVSASSYDLSDATAIDEHGGIVLAYEALRRRRT